MKLNPDCLRAVLLAYEALPAINRQIGLPIDGFSEEEIFYHQQLLEDAGFIRLQWGATGDDPYRVYPHRLTYAGHEFLNASRNNQAWDAVKKAMAQTGGFVVELAKPILLELLTNRIHELLKQ